MPLNVAIPLNPLTADLRGIFMPETMKNSGAIWKECDGTGL